MKLKNIVAALSVLGLATAGTAVAAGQDSVQAQIQKLQEQVSALQGQVSSNHGSSSAVGQYIATDSKLTNAMLGVQGGVNREMNILNMRKSGDLKDQTLYVGGRAQAGLVYQHSDTEGTFRSFTSTSTTTKSATGFQLYDTNLNVLANINSWIAGYVNLAAFQSFEHNETTGGNVQVKDAYVVVGNLSQSPVYGFAGKKAIDFGNFETVNFFTMPLNRAAFQAQGDTLGAGFAQDGFNGTVSFMNGGTEGNNLRTGSNDHLNNFAVNLAYGMNSNGVDWTVGAGYLNGTGYNNQSNGNPNNPAWDINAHVGVDNLRFIAEYTQTMDDVALNKHLSAWDIGAAYDLMVMGYNSTINLDYSAVKGPVDTSALQSHTYSQYVAGYNVEVFNNTWVGLEYSYNKGVINTAGSSATFSPDANNNTIALNAAVYF